MPRKQVYGKRSRAIYDPFQAFVSPQRPAPKSNIREQGVFVAEVIEELSRLKVGEKAANNVRKDGRRALGERSANESVDPVKKALEGGKTKRRRRKVVEEDDDDVEITATIREEDGQEQRRPRSLQDTQELRPDEPETREVDFVADNVPMFMDGHGYDTEDDEDRIIHPVHGSVSYHGRPKETSHDSETPSISILPPTPPPEDDEYTTHCSSLLDHSSHGIKNFVEWSNQLSNHFAVTKIAEASFGEVYRLSLLEDLSSFSHSDESVLKIIALKPPETILPPASKKKERNAMLKKAEAMSKVEDVTNEVKLLQRMSTIPGFTNFRDVRVIQGRPPQPFIKAFKDFNVEQKARKKDLSVFPDPAKKASYADDQLWAVIEMQDAGVDLERYVEQGQYQSIWSVWDVFWQVVLTLAKGEEGAEFEHRDLHLGNVCVRKRPTSAAQEKDGDIDTKRKLDFTGLETTIIDYTISRALLTSSPSTAEAADIAFHDLFHPSSASIFEGDSTEEYQYDIYRYMRGCVLQGDPYYVPPPTPSSTISKSKSTMSTPWSTYTPRTNLIWLHYLLHSLLEQLAWPSATKAPPKKRAGGKDHAVWKRANDLEHVLLRVQELLDPGMVCDVEGLGGASALVGFALEEGWVDVEDVVGSGDGEDENGIEEELELVEGLGGLTMGGKAVGEGETLTELGAVDEPGTSDTLPKGAKTRRKK